MYQMLYNNPHAMYTPINILKGTSVEQKNDLIISYLVEIDLWSAISAGNRFLFLHPMMVIISSELLQILNNS